MATLSLKEAFRLARLKMGLSQNQLALQLGVSNTTIRNYEKGRRGSRPDPAVLWNFSNIAPPEFRAALRSLVPENFRRAVEHVGEEIEGHSEPRHRRYSSDAISQLHDALDIIIDRAPSETVLQVQRFLEKRAGMWSEHTEHPRSSPVDPYMVPSEFRNELEKLAIEGKQLDKAVILLDVLQSGVDAQRLKIRGKRQAESDREGQARVHRGKKTK